MYIEYTLKQLFIVDVFIAIHRFTYKITNFNHLYVCLRDQKTALSDNQYITPGACAVDVLFLS